MQHYELESPKELRDTIEGFWYTRIDFEERPSGFEILPDGYAEIIFHFGSGCTIGNNARLTPLPSPFLMGLLGKPVLLQAKGILEIIGVKCFPWAVFDMLGLPSGSEGVRIFEHPMARLQSPLAALVRAGSITEALQLIRQYFLEAQMGMAPESMLFKAGVAMKVANGNLPVSQVAAAAHATVRTLERKFRQSSGYTVKDVSGLIRFEQVRNHLWLYPDTGLAGLAQELGYADQAHLSREFKRYSGTTPAAFARKVKSDKRAGNDDFVAFVQA